MTKVGQLDPANRARNPQDSPASGADEIEWPDTLPRGAPVPKSQENIRRALAHLGLEPWLNTFSHKFFVRSKDGCDEIMDDSKIREIFLALDRLGLMPPKQYFLDVLFGVAEENTRNPIREQFDALKWDGVSRLDDLATKYFHTKDSPYARAAFRKVLIAVVRRVRQPGAKFDTLLVLEGEQGCGKSSAIQILATPELFTDCVQPGDDPRLTIENTNGRLIVELSELNGLSKRLVETTKAWLSRQADTARRAYERIPVEIRRQFIAIGTTNSESYLKDVTGNRRFWPVAVGKVDLEALKTDRDQLIAEAAHFEALGEPLTLPEELWEMAAAEQAARLIGDPWFEQLQPHLEGEIGAIPKEVVWSFLGIEAHRQDPHIGTRLTEVMSRLGFKPNRRRLHGEKSAVYVFETEDGVVQDGMPKWLSLPTRQK